MSDNSSIEDEDQKRKKKTNFKGKPQDIEERTGSDELNWTRLESLEIFLNVFVFSMTIKRRRHGERGVI